jgi:hypothetical protein
LFGPWFWYFIGRDDANRILVNLFENHDDEASIGDMPPRGRKAAGVAVAFTFRSSKDSFDIRNGQIMLRNMLDVATRIIVSEREPESER